MPLNIKEKVPINKKQKTNFVILESFANFQNSRLLIIISINNDMHIIISEILIGILSPKLNVKLLPNKMNVPIDKKDKNIFIFSILLFILHFIIFYHHST